MSNIVTLSEAASIGLHAVILIAQSDKPLNVRKVAERTQSSKHHVAKVMQRLSKQGFLGSLRGPSGGFFLKQPAESITLLDIYEAIEGKIEMTQCPLDKLVCPFGKCIMNNITNKMTKDFRNYLSNNTVASFIETPMKSQ